jgi:uncharacterized protein YmfQ (DUF2313 family)
MPPPTYSATDYLAQFQRLLPRGRVWHRGVGLVQDADLLTLMPAWVRLHLRLNDLIAQIFPCTTTELVPEWEASLGLPDPCTGPLPTLQQRQAAVCAKFKARGGQTKAYFIAVAASLGYTIEITEFAPFRAGQNRAGDPDYGADWAYAWRVSAIADTIWEFSAGASSAGEPLRAWGNEVLECALRAVAPAHTVLQFAYFLGGSNWDEGQSIWDDGASPWDLTVGSVWDQGRSIWDRGGSRWDMPPSLFPAAGSKAPP